MTLSSVSLDKSFSTGGSALSSVSQGMALTGGSDSSPELLSKLSIDTNSSSSMDEEEQYEFLTRVRIQNKLTNFQIIARGDVPCGPDLFIFSNHSDYNLQAFSLLLLNQATIASLAFCAPNPLLLLIHQLK